MPLKIVYIARGKLYLKTDHLATQVVASQFVQDMQERLLRSQRRNAWRSQGLIEFLYDALHGQAPAHGGQS
jgi:hypothetical protein